MERVITIETAAAAASPLVLQAVAASPYELLLQRIAIIDEHIGSDTGRLTYWDALLTLNDWRGDRQVQGISGGERLWQSKPVEITIGYDTRKAGDRAFLGDPKRIQETFAPAFARGKLVRAWQPIRDSALSLDDQNFFDVDHTPIGGGSTSNLIARGAGVPETPAGGYSVEQAAAELEYAIHVIEGHVPATGGIEEGLVVSYANVVVTCYNDDKHRMFKALSRQDFFIPAGGTVAVPNPYKGLTVLRDSSRGYESAALLEAVDVIAAYGNVKPVIFIPTEEPTEVEEDRSQHFNTRQIRLGVSGSYAAVAAFWQCGCRIYEPFGG